MLNKCFINNTLMVPPFYLGIYNQNTTVLINTLLIET